MSTVVKDLGAVTAYAYAVAGGYVGTEQEFTDLLGKIAEDLAEIEGLSVTVTTLPAGSSATASYADGVLSLGIPKGDKGDTGDTGATGATGADGFSPTVAVSPIAGGHEVAITDAVQTQTFNVLDGEVLADGSYENLTAGNALELQSNLSETDSTPYMLRSSGGGVSVGTREEDEIVGGSIVWNQLCDSASVTIPNGRKYLMKKSGAYTVGASTGSALTGLTSGTDMVIDLTAMFGSSVADLIYTKEQGSAGAGVAYLRSICPRLFEGYVAYDVGTLEHVSGVSAHVMRDADDNIIASYPLDSTLTLRGVPKVADGKVAWDGDVYSADGTVTRKYGLVEVTSAMVGALNTDGDVPRVRISVTPLPLLNSLNTLTSNGYAPRSDTPTAGKWIRCVSAGFHVWDAAFTDLATAQSLLTGMVIVYELATPTTETAEPYMSMQIVDAYGTEEYVTTGNVAVGHVTRYPVSQVNKLDKMPNSLFFTETGLKATRAYTVNQLLVIGGQLYKVNTSIASGATLTVGTNITAISLGDILTSLLNA